MKGATAKYTQGWQKKIQGNTKITQIITSTRHINAWALDSPAWLAEQIAAHCCWLRYSTKGGGITLTHDISAGDGT